MPSWQMLASIFLVIKMSFSTCMLCVGHPRVCFGKVIRLNIQYLCSLYQNSIVQSQCVFNIFLSFELWINFLVLTLSSWFLLSLLRVFASVFYIVFAQNYTPYIP